MAIRLRIVPCEGKDGFHWVALCAAESQPMDGDVYIDDPQHNALGDKFEADFRQMGFLKEESDGK